MIEGIRRFFEQDVEVKKSYYSREYSGRSMVYSSNFDLYTGRATDSRDTVLCRMTPDSPDPDHLPIAFRDKLMTYSKQVKKLGRLLFELLSEALALQPSHLNDIGCSEGLSVLGHYYPACLQLELAMGTARHTDSGFLTVLLQDQVGGLQILHDDQWIDVPPMPGALVINIADLLQLLSNDKFRSMEHKVEANSKGPRISGASFFRYPFDPVSRVYAPIKELLLEANPPRYHRRKFMHPSRSCYQKLIRPGIAEPQAKTLIPSTATKGSMVFLLPLQALNYINTSVLQSSSLLKFF